MAGKRTMKAAKKKPNTKAGSAKKSGSGKSAGKPPQKPAKKAAPAKKPAKKAPPPKASKPAGKKAAPPKAAKEAPQKPSKAAAKAAPPAPQKPAAGKAGAKPQLAKSLTRPAMPPPRPTTPVAQPALPSRPKGETLTLVPARSSSSGLRPRQDLGQATGRPGSAPGPARTRPSSGPKREGVTLLKRTSERPSQTPAAVIPIPVRKVEAPPTMEERFARIEKRLEELDEATRKQFWFLFDQAWV
ncbi:MAG: hypothetical protein JNK04_01885, partial [Myxococcales bacterium]|nr:hypothetical protein [Myxococcales bacterium]